MPRQTASRSCSIQPGWGDMQFELPMPGTYKLPPFGKAADGNVLTDEGEKKRLSDFYGDKVVLLSFMFTQCSDLNGCPLVTAVYYKLKEALKNDPELSDQLRLVSLSFDPKYDTPEVMKFYGQFDPPLDKYLFEHFFKDKKDGVSIEAGASNGLLENSTKFFAKIFYWCWYCCRIDCGLVSFLL